MKVVFRADASVEMGTGHVFRCLTLARLLVQQGAEVGFVCRDLPGNLIDFLRDHGFRVATLPAPHAADDINDFSEAPRHAAWARVSWQVDQRQVKAACAELGVADWLVVDHYAFDQRWEEGATPWAKKILAIDDLADRRHAADLLLDQTLGRTDSDYEGLVPAKCRKLLGAKFALLRPEFAEARAPALDSRSHRRGVRRVLVTAGGTDPENVTGKILEAVEACGTAVFVDVVLGNGAPHIDEVKEKAARLGEHVRVLVGVANMAALMSEADLAVGAAGTTSWERCCVGLPALIVTTAENQWSIAQALDRAGAAKLLGSQDHLEVEAIRAAVMTLLDDYTSLRAMSEAAASICDGQGAARVAQEML